MVGFPHSEIPGSKLIRSSPRLIAAYYVLHRLHAPRHPLDALKTLDRSHYQCPQCQRRQPLLKANVSIVGIVNCRRNHCGNFDRSDQINQNSRGSTALSGVRIKQAEKPSLYDVERSGSASSEDGRAAKLALCVRRYSTGRNWWSRSGSNRRPEACKATALPTELRPHSISRMVGPGRLELPTLRLSGVRSNHLSYGPPLDHARVAGNSCGRISEPRGRTALGNTPVSPGRTLRTSKCPRADA